MKKLIVLLTLTGFILVSSNIQSQAPDTLWTRCYGGTGADKCNVICQTHDNNFLIAGTITSNDLPGFHGGSDGWIVKINGEGDTLWSRTFETSEDETITDLIESSSGDIVFCGRKNNDYWIVKTDSTGNLIWSKTYGGSAGDIAKALVESNDSCFVVAGYSFSNDGDVGGGWGPEKGWILKIDKNGNKIWKHYYRGSVGEEIYDIIKSSDGNYLLTGVTSSMDLNPETYHGGVDCWILKIGDDYGELLWSRAVGSEDFEYGYALDETPDGQIIVTGYYWGPGLNDLWVAKLNSNGYTQWIKTLGMYNGDDYGYDILALTNEEYIVVGGVDTSFAWGIQDYWILELNSNGDTIWTKQIGGSSTENAMSVSINNMGDFFIAGYSYSNDNYVHGNHGYKDFYIAKLENDGLLIYPKPIDQTETNISAFSVDLGWTEMGSATSWEIILVERDSDTTGVEPETVNTNPYTWNGLLPETQYEWYIRSKYDDGNVSRWRGPSYFQTISTCPQPFFQHESNITAYSSNLFWTENASATNWDILLDTVGFDTVGRIPITVNSNPYTWNNLDPDTEYEWYLRSDCGGDDHSYWIGPHNFRTKVTCPKPTHLTTEKISSNSVKFGWYENGGATNWEIRIGETGFDTTGITPILVNDNPYIWNSVLPDNGIEWYIRSVCSDQDKSYWAGPGFNPLNSGLLQTNTYGGSNDDGAPTIRQTNDGGYILAGRTRSDDGDVSEKFGNDDVWIVKLNEYFEIEWEKSFGGSGNEGAKDIQQTDDNGYIITGHTSSKDGYVWGYHGGTDVWIVKLNEYGDTLWTHCYGGSKYDIANSIQQTSDGGYIVVGITNSFDGDVVDYHGELSDAWVVKLDGNGTIEWSKCFGIGYSGGTHFSFTGNSVIQTSDEGYAICGQIFSIYSNGNVHSNYSAFLYKLDENGNLIWGSGEGGSYVADDSYPINLNSVKQTSNGEFIGIGYKDVIYLDDEYYYQWIGYKTWSIKLDISGNKLWSKYFGDENDNRGSDISELNPDRFIITSNVGGSPSTDILIIEINTDGDSIWSKQFGGSNNDYGTSILSNSDGDIVVAGYTKSNDGDVHGNHGEEDFWVVALDGNWIPPVGLPFTEDWETYSGTTKTNNDTIGKGTYHNWVFQTDKPNQGRARWGTNAYMSYGGNGALTMDKVVGNGSNAMNYAVLTLNLSNYINDDIYLSFSWADHNDEENPGDKVWVRGNANDDWVEIYDFNPELFTDNAFHDVKDLDIDETLANASPSQTVSSTFQLRFGQQDNYWANYDGITIDDIVISDEPMFSLSPVTLPFIEDWESYSGTVKRDSVFYLPDHSWAFETDMQNQGRARWGSDAYMAYGGAGALTLDKTVGNGSFALNNFTLTLDMSGYSTSSDLELSFYWADHNDEENVNDKVWIRGSDVDDWVQIVDLNPESFADNTYHLVDGLDIDATLSAASPAQAVSESFQLRFGQEDNYWANYDGISFDDILIEENLNKSAETGSSEEDIPGNIGVYYTKGTLYIKSSGKAALEEKHVSVYDMYGRTMVIESFPPGKLTKIRVNPCSCYLVVKINTNSEVKVEKVFVY